MCPSKTIIKKVSRRSFLAAPALVLPSLTLARAETMLEGDGGANAPTGAPQFPMLLSNYAVRPPWQIAGVDYAVGLNANYGTSTAWKIPNGVTGGNTALPSGATLSGGNRIQISSANVTMNGWDLTQGAGQSLLVQGDYFSLINCKLLKTDDNYSMLEVYNQGCVVKYCDFNMNGHNSDSTAMITWHNVGSSPTSGLTVQYCYLRYTGSDFLYPQGASGVNYSLFNFNFFIDAGCMDGVHPDWMQMGGGSYHCDFGYNVFVQRKTPRGSQPLVYSDSTAVQGVVNNNLFLAPNIQSPSFPGSSSLNSIFYANSALVTGVGLTVTNNYFDSTADGGWRGSYGSVTRSGNINLLTGAAF
jgi:hypothetical protein